MRLGRAVAVMGLSLVGSALASAAPQPLPFTDAAWKLDGDAKRETVDGRDAVSLSMGRAARPDVRLMDGTIEMDVQLTRRRSFVYVDFRVANEAEREEFYLRPHKSSLPDAVQYAPVFQGQSGWQLYHGPGATAAVEFTPGAWTRVRIVLSGRRAALFVGDTKTPVLVVPRMAHEAREGGIGLRGFLPPDTPGEGAIARFANVVIDPGTVSYDFATVPSAAVIDFKPGLVQSWAVSAVLPAPAADGVPTLPAAPGPLRAVEAEPQGFVHLHKHVTLAPKSRTGTALARVHVRAEAAGTRAFDLGFSDVASIFLNGRPVMTLDHRYSFDAPRQEGLVGFHQARVYLPLAKGDNELAVLVSDGFGGWAVMGRFADPKGLTIEAR